MHESWFARDKSHFRPRAQVIADVAETDFAIAPEFTDAVERGIIEVGIHENGFDEDLMLKIVVDIFIAICRMMGVCNSHVSMLLIRVLCSASSASISTINEQTLYDRIRFSAATIRAGGGGHGFYSRSVSRAHVSPSVVRPEPEGQHPQQQQQEQQQP